MTKSTTFIAVCLLACLPADAGVRTLTGTSVGFWDTRAVVVAKLGQGEYHRPDGRVAIDVLAVGPTGLREVGWKLTVTWVAGGASALDDAEVGPGDTVVLLVERRDGAWLVDRHCVEFFGTGRPAMRVKDRDDKRVAAAFAGAAAAKRASEAKNGGQ